MDRSEKDHLIIERVKKGDQSALRQLVEIYKDDAFSLACSILKDRQKAEDVLQEAFMKVFEKIATFKYDSTFYTWLYRIVVNRCYNELRKKKTIFGVIKEPASRADEAFALTDSNNKKQLIHYALNQMKADEALILRLFYLSELKIPEVEKITGFGKSKVKVTLHRARKSFADILRKKLGKEIQDL